MMPRAGRDYPGSVGELLAWFSSDAGCRDYLEWLRWPEGFVCSQCGHAGGWRLGDGRWMCAGCSHRTSVTAGTIFDRTRTPLTVWFNACWAFATAKDGISALSLQRTLEIGSYQTAWAMLHRFIADHVQAGSTVITDGWAGYLGIEAAGYVHDRRSQRAAVARGEDPDALLPGVHRIAALAKRWLLSTHQGAVDREHLPGYLNEFVFRFNRRTSASRGLVFMRVLQLAVGHDPVRYRELIRGPGHAQRRRSRPARRDTRPASNAHDPTGHGDTPTCTTPVKWRARTRLPRRQSR